MSQHKVWMKMNKKDIPKGRTLVKCKWVFEIKRNGVFRARLVACGYSQIPGIDFNEIYSPVINDSTFKILIVIILVLRYYSMLIDIETAFLHGDLAEQIYMQCPEGVGDPKSECVKLLKTIYGLAQSSREFFKKMVTVLKEIGFNQNQAEPCLLKRENKKGITIIGLYIDDCLIAGDKMAVRESINDIKKVFSVKETDNLEDYLSCQILFDKERKKAWIGQPHMIKKLDKTFNQYIKHGKTYSTPGTPNHVLVRPKDNDPLVEDWERDLYRTGVGMLLYLVKHSRPDIANAVRELSKLNDGVTRAAMKELFRVIKYVLDTRQLGLKIEPDLTLALWTIVAFSDSDWAGDKDTRLSTSGFIIFWMGVPIVWRSKAQRVVALSSSEAEYYALSEAAKEVKFIAQTAISMGLKVQLPIVVRVDNIGAIFMAENITATSRTRHVDLRYRFIKQFQDDGFLRIVFVKTEENCSDLMTKNVKGELNEKHSKRLMADKSYIN